MEQMMGSVWSSALTRTLRQALKMSAAHQQTLLESFAITKGEEQITLTELENGLTLAVRNGKSGSKKDLVLTSITARIVEHKLNAYQQLLSIPNKNSLKHCSRMLGAALSDEVATSLFLQELAERFSSR